MLVPLCKYERSYFSYLYEIASLCVISGSFLLNSFKLFFFNSPRIISHVLKLHFFDRRNAVIKHGKIALTLPELLYSYTGLFCIPYYIKESLFIQYFSVCVKIWPVVYFQCVCLVVSLSSIHVQSKLNLMCV